MSTEVPAGHLPAETYLSHPRCPCSRGFLNRESQVRFLPGARDLPAQTPSSSHRGGRCWTHFGPTEPLSPLLAERLIGGAGSRTSHGRHHRRVCVHRETMCCCGQVACSRPSRARRPRAAASRARVKGRGSACAAARARRRRGESPPRPSMAIAARRSRCRTRDQAGSTRRAAPASARPAPGGVGARTLRRISWAVPLCAVTQSPDRVSQRWFAVRRGLRFGLA
jgi:hypothetical protein